MPNTTTYLSEPDTLTLDIFFADERPDLAALYCAGQTESLRRYPGALAARAEHLDGACVVLARDRRGQAHGGMRVHLHRPDAPLPIEHALGDLCPIRAAIERAPAPLVELAGTWISAEYQRSDLAVAVTRATLAVARALGARRIIGCAHQHVLAFYRRFGAVVDASLGVHPYPDPRYETRVFWADATICPDGQDAIDACVARIQRGEPLHFTRHAA